MAPTPRYQLLEHTADLFVRYEAPDLAGLFAVAAQSLGELTFGSQQVRTAESRHVAIGPEKLSELFLDWLRELLYLLSTEGFCVARAQVELSLEREPDCYSLKAELLGEPVDSARHTARLEIKTPTYHRYRIESGESGWQADVLFDV